MDFAAILVISIYLFIGPALIMINQYILKSLHFPYPMFLSGLGVLASGLFAQFLVFSKYVKLQKLEAVEGVLWYKRVLPVGLSFALTLTFGNMVYLYLDVGFIQMLKSFTPVIIMLTGYLANIEFVTAPVCISVIVISLGTATTCSGTPSLSAIGIGIMFLSEFAEAIRLIITQFFLQQLKFGVIESQYVLAPASAFWLFSASAIAELPSMLENGGFQVIMENPLTFLCAAATGIGVNFITYFVIQYTSSLSMKILGTVRNIMMVVIGVLFYKELITSFQAFGYTISLAGFISYNLAKMGYFDAKQQKKDRSEREEDIEELSQLLSSSAVTSPVLGATGKNPFSVNNSSSV